MEFETPLYIEFKSDGNIVEFLSSKKGVYTYKYVKLQKNSTLTIGSFINWKTEDLWKVMMSSFTICHYKRIDHLLDPIRLVIENRKPDTEEIVEDNLRRTTYFKKEKRPKQDIQGKLF